MNLVISNKSEQPIFKQIYGQIVSEIVTGELPPNFCLPSIRVIASELGVSIITIKKAWEMLEADGFIYTKAGKGCFVIHYGDQHMGDKKISLAQEKLTRDLSYYKSLGLSLNELIQLIKNQYDE